VFEKIFGPKGDEVTRDWRKLHNEEFYDAYFSPNIKRVIISRMRLAWHVARLWDGRSEYSDTSANE